MVHNANPGPNMRTEGSRGSGPWWNLLVVLLLVLGSSALYAEDAADEVLVFILAGQSNMVGHGKPDMGRNPDYVEGDKASQREVAGGIGSLRRFIERHPEPYGAEGTLPLVNADGSWRERDDVLIHCTTERGAKHGHLTPHFGKGEWFGPEFGFGHIVGEAFAQPVLIIKTAWGGHSLGIDFRPPSSGEPQFTKAKYEPDQVGRSYRAMLSLTQEVLANMETLFPELAGKTPRLAGFGWHQGWNDGVPEMTAEYEANMVNLITDLRRDLGVPDLPVVIANTGMIGVEATGVRAELCEIQLALGDPEKHPEFAGTVASVETRPFKRSEEQSPSKFGYHWNHNGESHWLLGEAMGVAMLELLPGSRQE